MGCLASILPGPAAYDARAAPVLSAEEALVSRRSGTRAGLTPDLASPPLLNGPVGRLGSLTHGGHDELVDNLDPTTNYLVPAELRHRLNAWLSTQGFDAARISSDEAADDNVPTYLISHSSTPVGDDAVVTVQEAARLLFVSQNTVNHWVASGRIRRRETCGVPVSDVERLREERGRGLS